VAHVLIMPRQGNTVESCLLVRWRVKEGAKVASPDEVVCEVETDKATFEVNAGAAGVLLKTLRGEGDDVPVLEPIAVIGEQGEDWQAAVASAAGAGEAPPSTLSPASAAEPAKAPVSERLTPEKLAPAELKPVSPRARHLAEDAGLDPARLPGTGPAGRVIERDVKAALAARPSLTAAARAAVTAGAPLPESGTALGGRVGLKDLPAVVRPAPPAAGQPGASETPLRGIRKIIADRMRSSLSTTAQLTFHGSAPAARISALRARFKGSDPALGLSGVTIGDLVLYAVSRVVPKFPSVNAHLVGTTLRTFERVHLGLAVDTPRGLMVPVIRNADQLGLSELSAEAKRLAQACLKGNVALDELSGATFTVSNLGAFGVESFTPVLNTPEVGILGVSAIVPRVAAGKDGQLVLEPRMGLSLTVDHQVVDGAPAARILKAFSDAIADIDLLWAR